MTLKRLYTPGENLSNCSYTPCYMLLHDNKLLNETQGDNLVTNNTNYRTAFNLILTELNNNSDSPTKPSYINIWLI